MNADLMNGTIVMSQNEARKAGRFGTDEYEMLAKLMQQFPAFRIEVVKPSAKRTDHFKGLTRAYMKQYVESHDSKKLADFYALCGLDESGKKQEFARVRHIPLSAARLDKVTAVNQLSREIEEGLHAPKEAKAWLLDIQRMPDKPRWHQVLASGVGSACFCFLFGGDVVDSMVAFLSGFVLYFYLLYLLRGRMSKIATNISGGALVTLIAVFLYQAGIGHHLDKVIIGSIIPLVPGVNFTNAIRDIADQDYIAGSVRMLDALLVTFCIALGVGLIITGYHQLAGGLQL